MAIILTGAFGVDQDPALSATGWYRYVNPMGSDYRSNVYRIAKEKHTGFLDMRGAILRDNED